MFKKELALLVSRAGKISSKQAEALIEIPPDSKMGDYALPCFALAAKFRKNPVNIADDIAAKIKPGKLVERAEAKGAYVNFFINKKAFAEEVLKSVNSSYGQPAGKPKEKIVLEHTSVNPNASPHVGRVRNSIIGDSICRILEFSRHKVETRYYVNDVSKQVAMLALVFKHRDKFEDLLGKYVKISGRVEKDKKLEKQCFELIKKLEDRDKGTLALFKKIVDTAVKGQKKIFSSIGINFDYFDYESRYIRESRHILKELEATGKIFEDREGRKVLDQSGTGLEKSMKSPVMVLTRSDGTGLYPLRDIAYTIDKGKRGRNIIVLGEDQKLYFEQIRQALNLLKKPVPEAVHYSFVLLEGKGKMSTRRGEVVLLSEFLSQALKKACAEIKKRKTKGDAKKVAIAAIKYAMLRNENNKNITFNLDRALNFEGETGPYLQYSYARAASILRKSKKKAQMKLPARLQEKEIELVKSVSEFPGMVERASKSLSPSIIANYAYQLSQIFNEFYHGNKVIGSEKEEFLLKLVDSFRITLKNALCLLGIDVMEEM